MPGVGGIAIVAEHFQRVARINAQAQARCSQESLDGLRSLTLGVGELRETSTKFDIGFDVALQSIDTRVSGMEQPVTTIEQESRVRAC